MQNKALQNKGEERVYIKGERKEKKEYGQPYLS